ncbi:hypothetical protein GC175_05230 [bacterium]|nr:hypothetical protein [bacterium]
MRTFTSIFRDPITITAPGYSAVYHREGCGFVGLWDRDGNDWITYRPTGGEYGHYRGIPNMGYNSFGHPGYAFGARTTVLSAGPAAIPLLSESADGAWRTTWDFFPDRMVQVIETVGGLYWWLYEGTPGGHFRPDSQYALLSDGTILPCAQRYAAPAKTARHVCFVDPSTRRCLRLSALTPEPTVDIYWPMGGEGGMTVWGFGRHDHQGPHAHLQQTPAIFSVAFVEEIDAVNVGAAKE